MIVVYNIIITILLVVVLIGMLVKGDYEAISILLLVVVYFQNQLILIKLKDVNSKKETK